MSADTGFDFEYLPPPRPHVAYEELESLAEIAVEKAMAVGNELTPEDLLLCFPVCIEEAWANAMKARNLAMLPTLPATPDGISRLPKQGACVYRIYGTYPGDPTNEVLLLYVGGTTSPRNRLHKHLSSGRFPGAQCIAIEACVWSSAIAEIEERAIKWEQPVENSEGVDGNGYRRHGGW